MNRANQLQRRIRLLTWLFVIGLVLSGATAIPLEWELDLSARILGVADSPSNDATSGLTRWILKVREALRDTNANRVPMLAQSWD